MAFILVIAILVSFPMGFVATASGDDETMPRESEVIVAENDSEEDPPVFRYSYIASIGIKSLSISGTTATMICRVTGFSGITTKIVIEGTLQKSVSGTWSTAAPMISTTTNSYTATFNKTATATKGYNHRVKFVVKAYSGTSVETVTVYSNTVFC